MIFPVVTVPLIVLPVLNDSAIISASDGSICLGSSISKGSPELSLNSESGSVKTVSLKVIAMLSGYCGS